MAAAWGGCGFDEAIGSCGKSKSRFFIHHPRTYPTELSLCRAPGAFGAPFVQNDSRLCRVTAVAMWLVSGVLR